MLVILTKELASKLLMFEQLLNGRSASTLSMQIPIRKPFLASHTSELLTAVSVSLEIFLQCLALLEPCLRHPWIPLGLDLSEDQT